MKAIGARVQNPSLVKIFCFDYAEPLKDVSRIGVDRHLQDRLILKVLLGEELKGAVMFRPAPAAENHANGRERKSPIHGHETSCGGLQSPGRPSQVWPASATRASSAAKKTGSKMKKMLPAYQCGLKGKNGRRP